jgi:hypothetical protein
MILLPQDKIAVLFRSWDIVLLERQVLIMPLDHCNSLPFEQQILVSTNRIIYCRSYGYFVC